MLEVGKQYTREQVQELIGAPVVKGGIWATGYAEFNGQIYAFSTINAPGRTGHDYENAWKGDRLSWQGKSTTVRGQPQIEGMISGALPTHIFVRNHTRPIFTYVGIGTPVSVSGERPVTIEWAFEKGRPMPPLTADELADNLSALGFTLHPTMVKSQLVTREEINIYLKRDTRSSPLVIDPKWQDHLSDIVSIEGVWRTKGNFFYHQSTLLKFPLRRHGGKADTHYGFDLEVGSVKALQSLISFLTDWDAKPRAPFLSENDPVDPQTETEALRAARLGQSKFRNNLLAQWAGKCALTGVELPEMIRASHIKPWAKSTNQERLDPGNGLPLLVHIDLLFDRGWISFEDDGTIIFSPRMTEAHGKTFGLSLGMRLLGLSPQNKVYLEHHRNVELKAT